MCRRLGGLGEELLRQRNQRRPAHEEPATEQYAAHAQRAQALDLAVAAGEAVGRGLQGPADGREGEDVADEVGEAVDGVGEKGCPC